MIKSSTYDLDKLLADAKLYIHFTFLENFYFTFQGYYSEGNEIVEIVMDVVRREAEQCDMLQVKHKQMKSIFIRLYMKL